MDNGQDILDKPEDSDANKGSKVIEIIKSVGKGIGYILLFVAFMILLVWVLEVLGIHSFRNSFLELPLLGFLPSPHDLISGLMGW